jgi:hypothetical protein
MIQQEEGGEGVRDETGGGGEMMRRSVGTSRDHQVVLPSPPRGR